MGQGLGTLLLDVKRKQCLQDQAPELRLESRGRFGHVKIAGCEEDLGQWLMQGMKRPPASLDNSRHTAKSGR